MKGENGSRKKLAPDACRSGASIPLVRTRGLWRGAPPLRTPCRPSRPFGAPGSGPARRRPPPPRRRPSRCCPCRAGRRRPRRRVSAAGNRPLVRLSTSPNRPSAAGTDGGRCGRTTPTTTILMKWSIVAPLVGASARARWRASEPSSKDTYGRERLHQRRVGGGTPEGTPGATHPIWPCRASGKKGGSLPSSPSPLARFGSSGPGRETRTTTAKKRRVAWDTPHPVFGTPPLLCGVPFCSTPAVTPIVTPQGSSGQLVRQLPGCQ